MSTDYLGSGDSHYKVERHSVCCSHEPDCGNDNADQLVGVVGSGSDRVATGGGAIKGWQARFRFGKVVRRAAIVEPSALSRSR